MLFLPHRYKFHSAHCNTHAVWTEKGATVEVPERCAKFKTEKSSLGWWSNQGGESKIRRTFAWRRSPVTVDLVSTLKEQKFAESGKHSCQQSSITDLAGCVGNASRWGLYLEHSKWCFKSRGISLHACWRHSVVVLRMAPVHSHKASFWILTSGSLGI